MVVVIRVVLVGCRLVFKFFFVRVFSFKRCFCENGGLLFRSGWGVECEGC